MYTTEEEENPTFNLTTKRTEKISLSNNLCGYFYFLFEITNITFIEIKCLKVICILYFIVLKIQFIAR